MARGCGLREAEARILLVEQRAAKHLPIPAVLDVELARAIDGRRGGDSEEQSLERELAHQLPEAEPLGRT